MPLLSVQNLTKYFGTLAVVNDVSFEIKAGEVVGLAGRNGSGRSATIQAISGLEPFDNGTVQIEGQPIHFPHQLDKASISFIHQDPALVDNLDIVSNIFLGNELGIAWLERWWHIPHQRRMKETAVQILNSLNAQLPPLDKLALNLTGEQRQLIAIAQVIARQPKLTVIDNPNRWLTYPYQQKLLSLIQQWHAQGTAVLFNSNNLDHLFDVTDRILVFREGKIAANLRTDETNRETVVSALVGTPNRQQRTPVIWALDSYQTTRQQAENLRHNQGMLQRDLDAQGSVNQQLVEQLAQQVAALDSANLALQDAQRRLLTEREEERKRLARELHDQIIQDLLSLNYDLEEIEEQLTTQPNVSQDVNTARQNVRTLVEDLRRVCGDLRPPTIDSLGLNAALQSLIRNWQARTGISVTIEIDEENGRLPESLELSIFRIIQEGLNNIWKHAQATEVELTLQHTSSRMLLISLTDNGRGLERPFDLAKLAQNGHYGLLGISERVALLGGRFHIQNGKPNGLIIQAEIPHPRMVKS